MVIDLTQDSDSEDQLAIQKPRGNFFSNLVHRTPNASGSLKRKSDRESEESSSVASAAQNVFSNGNRHSLARDVAKSRSSVPKTPSLSPGVRSQNGSQETAVSVVIPSPSQQLKKEIKDSEWTLRPELTGLSQVFYPTDAYEKRAVKGAYPSAKKVNRSDVPFTLGKPGALLKKKPNVHAELRQSLKRKLAMIEGPEVTLAPGDDRLLAGFAANFEFVNTYKLRKGVTPVPEAFNAGCGCEGFCDPGRCTCLSKEDNESNDNIVPYGPAKDDKRFMVLSPDFLKRTSMIFECSSRCNCNHKCWNRVVQQGRTIRLEIYHTGNRGFGLRSPDPIRAGQFIDCYLGEVITRETADIREELAVSQNEASYLFGLDFLINNDDIYVVDGQKFGSPTRFMNHSCNPNCRMFPVSRTHGDEKLYDLAFFALRNIPPNTELTFDYNPGWEGDKKVDPNAVKCLCGEWNCRGQLWPNQRKGTK